MKFAIPSVLVLFAACADAPPEIAAQARELHGNPNPGIAPPDSHPYGKSYGEWAADYWRWALPQPAGVNPLLDETGADCGQGQDGSVWFLAGNFNGTMHRECTVPPGRALFFPIANVFWIQTLQDPNLSIAEIRAGARELLDEGLEMSATIDGRPVVEPERYFEDSSVVTMRLPDDNVLGYDETICPRDLDGVIACDPFLDAGYYLFVQPLPRGNHTLRFTCTIPAFDFVLDITYTLHIE